ncbi:MAG TPA: selenocysteine-specific translation elongation factor [Bradyrhizobium sp.]|nr:selenocysteine-specific translation elongation factor [Bradyrhizobium sp.]
MIIGTAGHIDHGKTTLVRALTGVDTDRLPEEKARGISIELGYAYAPLSNGVVLGFVDVPGHERFVHTMLAGATGIDFALLVVAADDGVMPQTREHLHILTLLGIDAGAIALTKVDAVDAGRIATVTGEIRSLMANTSLAEAPIFAVSGRTGAGMNSLRGYLEQRALERDHPTESDAYFRLAVDRSFTLPGFGTVVTGTVHSGEVRIGDDLIVAPARDVVRVRGIHAQDRKSERGTVGQRCALNLAGIARERVQRGDWVVAPPIALSVERFDARLTLVADEERPLRSGAMTHLHLGTAHVPARVVILEAELCAGGRDDEIAPGKTGLVQFVLQRPIASWLGDRFIVRDVSASRTLGGGRVLDPYAPQRYRRSADRLRTLKALEAPSVAAQLAALIGHAPFGVDLVRFGRFANVCNPESYLRSAGVRRVAGDGADFAIDEDRWLALQAQVEATLDAFHRDHADQLGPDGGRLKRIAFPRLDETLYRALIAELIAAGKVRRSGPWLHLPGHTNEPSAPERALVEKVLPRLRDARFDPPWVRDLAKDAAQPEAVLRSALIRASKRGEVFQVVHDLFYHPIAIRELAALANGLQDVDGEVRAAAFRDSTGLGRKRAIQVLEFFDRIGFTRRVQDRHIVRTNNLLALNDPSIKDADTHGNVPIQSRQSA